MPSPAPPAAAGPTTARSGLPGLLARAPSSLWVFADQAVVSLANFVAPILVGRYAGQEELGFFALGFSVYLFLLGLAQALVWTAYTRRNAQLEESDRPAYAGSATVHLAGFLVLSVAVIAAVAGATAWSGAARYAWLLASVGPCAAVMILREHVRRLGLARFAFAEVFLFDLIVAVSQVALLMWMATSGRLDAVGALASLATTSLLGAVWLGRRRSTWRVSRGAVGDDWRENWAISKWLVGGGTAVLLGTQGYRWLLSVLVSIAELGRLGAAQVVVQVTNPLVLGAANYLGPVSAKIYADEGVAGLWRFTLKTSLIMAGAIALFLAGVAAVGLPLVRLVFRESAEGVTTMLLLTFSAGALSQAMLRPIEFASVNLGNTRLMFHTAIVRLAIDLTVGVGLVVAMGAEGIGVAMLLGSLVALVWQWVSFAQEAARA